MEAEAQTTDYSPERIQQNNRVIYNCRIFVATIAGCATGILGQTGLVGFLCYLLSSLLVSVFLLFKTQFKVKKYFTSWTSIWTEGLFQGILSFVLFWTLFYGFLSCY
eukprot:TRINITY_DN7042_c0_g1_i1.p1 TRINITY_DN7042_c0_g1~~TRINITY_DN7042_c0_g1_i1.p1  ORF type:complete len:107 (-),score=4.62 TRINITY_DN7042_c0_g1_i1:84-404(-)